MKMLNSQIASNKGVSIIFAVMIMTVSLAIALGVNVIFIRQLKMMKELDSAVVAFYAADHGIENALLDYPPQNISGTLGEASFDVTVAAGGTGDCAAQWNYCIKSTGIYNNTRRAVEVAY